MIDIILLVSICWVIVGIICIYYADKKAYNEGIVDAVIMHSEGELTYKFYEDEDKKEILEIKRAKHED